MISSYKVMASDREREEKSEPKEKDTNKQRPSKTHQSHKSIRVILLLLAPPAIIRLALGAELLAHSDVVIVVVVVHSKRNVVYFSVVCDTHLTSNVR